MVHRINYPLYAVMQNDRSFKKSSIILNVLVLSIFQSSQFKSCQYLTLIC